MNVVVVESPTKATTIGKYLGPDFTVLASYGHVRDLPAKDGSVRPDDDFAMDWAINEGSEKNLRAIGKALKGAENLYLATDPDREGEAISWHVLDELGRREQLNGVEVHRVVFTEITKTAVLAAMAAPRALDDHLVDAYKARRALDYLVGFTLSPVLWRKLPGSRSAGRVQSVALRLICDREAEIEIFRAQEYWTIDAALKTPKGEAVQARLTYLHGEKLDKFSLANEAAAKAAAEAVAAGNFSVSEIEPKRTQRRPPPPFTTSTLQQEASRKLGFAAKRTMQVAQQLYEGIEVEGERVGLITYMRTDGVHISTQAIDQMRSLMAEDYGADYVPGEARVYKAKAKNAQEAHEAIRPTDLYRRPAAVTRQLNAEQTKLYELIWKRTLASQMENAQIDQVGVNIDAAGGAARLRATGSTIAFDGFLKLYREGRDDANGEASDERILPVMAVGENMTLEGVSPDQHFTEPPPRYSEASLVKKLEELGIGRPSTYASIISVLQDRNYVRLEKKRFIPEDRGRIVTVFLENFFQRYIQYDFTASLEDALDAISAGETEWRQLLTDFWRTFSSAIDETKELRVKDVLTALDEALGPHIFPLGEDGKDPRVCPTCKEGRLNLKLGKFGPFIGCANYPECKYTRALGDEDTESNEPKVLGEDPVAHLPISIRKGPYGFYVQKGEASADKKDEKPKRVSLPADLPPDHVTLALALGLLALPREIGIHPESGKKIVAGIGRFGPYVKHESTYRSLAKDDDVLTIGENRAIALLAEVRQRGNATLRELGNHPDDGAPISVKSGRYGPYVQHKKTNATLPKTAEPETITLEDAVKLIAEKAAKKGTRKKPAPKQATAKKSTAKKAPKKAAKKPPKAASAKKPGPDAGADEPAAKAS